MQLLLGLLRWWLLLGLAGRVLVVVHLGVGCMRMGCSVMRHHGRGHMACGARRHVLGVHLLLLLLAHLWRHGYLPHLAYLALAHGLEVALGHGRRREWGMQNVVVVGVHRLDVLPQVIETRKRLAAVASERPFARVFSNVSSQMLRPGEGHFAVAVPRTLEDFRVLGFGFLWHRWWGVHDGVCVCVCCLWRCPSVGCVSLWLCVCVVGCVCPLCPVLESLGKWFCALRGLGLLQTA